ncbi:MAG: hypothetical protein AAF772_17875 [Acidobacteriota bacterium]
MTSSNPPRRVYEPGAFPALFKRPSIFLSASVPYARDPQALLRAVIGDAEATSDFFTRDAHPDRIRDTVVYIGRAAITRGYNLIFGGHPAITPLMLEVARRFALDDDVVDAASGDTKKRVITFQSEHFLDRIPEASRALGDETLGVLLWTPAGDGYDASLTQMRAAMTQVPNLRAAVFVGGMAGLFEEGHLARVRKLPCYAIATGGGAAHHLCKDGIAPAKQDDRRLAPHPKRAFHGASGDLHKDLLKQRSDALLVKRIFDEIDGLGRSSNDQPAL